MIDSVECDAIVILSRERLLDNVKKRRERRKMKSYYFLLSISIAAVEASSQFRLLLTQSRKEKCWAQQDTGGEEGLESRKQPSSPRKFNWKFLVYAGGRTLTFADEEEIWDLFRRPWRCRDFSFVSHYLTWIVAINFRCRSRLRAHYWATLNV